MQYPHALFGLQVRAFVANSFIRAAFELGNPQSPLLGTDPASKSNAQKKLETSLLAVLVLAKIAILGFAIKMLFKVVSRRSQRQRAAEDCLVHSEVLA